MTQHCSGGCGLTIRAQEARPIHSGCGGPAGTVPGTAGPRPIVPPRPDRQPRRLWVGSRRDPSGHIRRVSRPLAPAQSAAGAGWAAAGWEAPSVRRHSPATRWRPADRDRHAADAGRNRTALHHHDKVSLCAATGRGGRRRLTQTAAT